MNRLSRYAHLIKHEGKHYLFNVANGTVIILNPQLYTLINDNKTSIDTLMSVHPDLYAGLVACKAIVNDGKDEATEIITQFEEKDNDPSVFGIIINPTLDCNLRCWYCYETHGKGTRMSSEVLESIKRLIDKKVRDNRLKHLDISFFGGEPLLEWDKVVMPVLKYAVEKSDEYGVTLNDSFTTNGVLLSDERFEALIGIGLRDTKFQISIDGNKTFHDVSRVNTAKHPTYDKIMSNVTLGASKGFKISLRFNYTPETLDSYADVLTDLDALPNEVRKNISCSFHQVWQTMNDQTQEESNKKVERLCGLFRAKGFSSQSDQIYHRYVCYGDRPNHVVINFNGDLYKCTAREFIPSTREGHMTPQGDIIWNNRYYHRMALRYANPVCRECSIMPICNGGCAQNKIERQVMNGCPMGKSHGEKSDYLLMSLIQKIYE